MSVSYLLTGYIGAVREWPVSRNQTDEKCLENSYTYMQGYNDQ
jgi:hypothetical protein